MSVSHGLAVLALLVAHGSFPAGSEELSTQLMQSTFRLAGRGAHGTVFLMTVPNPETRQPSPVMVTAAHVLKAFQGDIQVLMLRQQKPSGKWEPLPVEVRIRDGVQRYWVQHPQADVAALSLQLPEAIVSRLVPASLLAEQGLLERLVPGEPIQIVGFPHGVPFVFPVLRSGPLASPVVVAEGQPGFLVSSPIYPGDSGAPVYRDGSKAVILGMVSQAVMAGKSESLQLASVVPSSRIRETLELLAEQPACLRMMASRR